ncbi:MAG: hypothetical protein AB7Y46_17450 [Armatimonadota bacterium]
MRTAITIAATMLAALPAGADWTLAEHAGDVLMYDQVRLVEFRHTGTSLRSQRGYFLPTATPGEGGGLVPYNEGMRVAGELHPGQMLLTPDNAFGPSWLEFVLHGTTRVTIDYGRCDGSKADGTRLHFFFHRADDPDGDAVADVQIELTEQRWQSATVDLPGGDLFARVRVEFIGTGSTNWTALVVSGDGEFGTREEASALSPLADQLTEMPTELPPAEKRVTARPGYDALFFGDEAWINYASKGHGTGTQAIQKEAGINLFYDEGAGVTVSVWPEGADRPVITPDSPTFLNMYLCRREGMPYKTAVGIAHCVFYLPKWLVAREGLGMEEHIIREADPRHTSFIKPRTLYWSLRALECWVPFFADQASIFVLGQEDQIDQWDDQSAEAQAAWRAWLREHFAGDFDGFAAYVGGIAGCTSFDEAPYLDHFASHEAYGYPRRAAYLKYLWQVEAYAAYLRALKEHCHELAPAVPVTQRYVISPASVAISRMGDFDYNYMYGHLSEEGAAGRYGSGKKIWTSVYGYCGLLPLPRGGSIGLTRDANIRRTGMTEAQWELNAFTLLANGCTGYEQSPFFESWGERWEQAALADTDGNLNDQGRLSRQVMGRVTSLGRYCEHYDRYEDVAVFHDSPWQSGSGLGSGLSQSKVGIYTLIRELGYHADPLTVWDMTAENLRDKKVLVLAGTVPIAPEIQEAIREYVRGGGTVLAFYSAAGEGFPGCNSWEFRGDAPQAARLASFEDPPAVAHLGDVLGIMSGGGSARHGWVTEGMRQLDLTEYNALVDEGRWTDEEACCATLVPAASAQVVAQFDDGSPAVVVNDFGAGAAITIGIDVGLIANNIVHEGIYAGIDQMLGELGCRKVYDTGSYYVEAGMWHNDAGERLLILVNHDAENARTAPLPDGTTVTIEPWRAAVWTSDRGVL